MSRKQDKPLPAPPPPQRDPPPPPPPERPPHIPQEGRAAWLVTPSSGLPRDPRAPLEAWSPKDSTALSDCRTSAADRSPKLAHAAPAHINGRPLSCSGADLGLNRTSHRLNAQSECSKVRNAHTFLLDHADHVHTSLFWRATLYIRAGMSFFDKQGQEHEIRAEKLLDIVFQDHLEPSVLIHKPLHAYFKP